MNKTHMTETILAAKRAKKKTWAAIAKAVGRSAATELAPKPPIEPP